MCKIDFKCITRCINCNKPIVYINHKLLFLTHPLCLQAMGQCPTVSIDKTDGCQMYLSKDSVNAEIVSAKSSEMNILVSKEDGDFVSSDNCCIKFEHEIILHQIL